MLLLVRLPKGNVVRENRAGLDDIILLGVRLDVTVSVVRQVLLRFKQLESVETAGAEVQKGNAIEERKIQRLSVMAMSLVLSRNLMTFGAGGVCVAIGELADGLEIDLNSTS